MAQLQSIITGLVEAAGINPEDLAFHTSAAEKLASGKPFFQNDNGESAFTRADKTQDKDERDKSLVNGIVSLLWGQKFDEAEKKLQKISDSKTAARLRDYMDAFAGETAIQQSAWAEVQHRASHINDRSVQIYLLLQAAKAAIKNSSKTKSIASEFLNEASRLNEKLDSSPQKTEMLLAAATLQYQSGEKIGGSQTLLSAIHEMNGDPSHFPGDLNLTIEIDRNHRMGLYLRDLNYEACFRAAASVDWEGTILLIENIASPKLRLASQVATASYSLAKFSYVK